MDISVARLGNLASGGRVLCVYLFLNFTINDPNGCKNGWQRNTSAI